jgi:hypothetical protein
MGSAFRHFAVWLSDILGTIHPNYYAVALLFSIAGVFVYIKIRYPFWNIQPVLHTYDWFTLRFTRTPYIVQKFPYKHKYYDNAAIRTLDYSTLSPEEKREYALYLQSHYSPTDRMLSTITAPALDHLLSGHNAPSFVSVYRELDGHISGIMTSRKTNVLLGSNTTIDAYLFDLMCIHRESSGRKIMEKLFQTHEYNQRIRNLSIAVSLFRMEGNLCEGVVPLVQYRRYTYYVRNLTVRPMPVHYQLSRVAKENQDILHNLYAKIGQSGFSLIILSDIGHLVSMLKSNETYLYCLKRGDQVCALYYFRNAHIHYEDVDCETLDLVASFQNTKDNSLFFSGFMNALRQCVRQSPHYKILRIDALGNNQLLLAGWREYHQSVMETECAYYLYNYIYPGIPLTPDTCMIFG